MAVLSVMSIQGNPDELAARMKETIEPVARRKAPQYGGISSTVVRTDDGIAIYNLWETEDGRHRMAEDTEVQAAVQAAGYPAPQFTGYEVISRQSVGEIGKELSRRMIDEVWTQGTIDVLDELLSPDHVSWDPMNGESRGIPAFREIVTGYRSAFPDMRMRIDGIVAEGDWVATSWTAVGTHTGELMGAEPTGREVTVSGMQLSRVADGKFAESRGVFDALGMLQQIGVVPAAAPAPA